MSRNRDGVASQTTFINVAIEVLVDTFQSRRIKPDFFGINCCPKIFSHGR
jgi:hypothetical protein